MRAPMSMMPDMAKPDPAIVAAATAAMYEIHNATQAALASPRNTDLARQTLLKRCHDPSFAERAIFLKPVGKKQIPGLSIRFAEEAAVRWKNIYCSKRVIYDNDDVRKLMIVVKDLEANITFSPELLVNKTVERKFLKDGQEALGERLNSYGQRVFLVRATEDDLMVKENAWVSKEIRNCILRLLPGDLKEDCFDEMQKTLETKINKDPDAEKKKILDGFGVLNVMPDKVASAIGKPLESLEPADIAELRKMYQAIKDGETTIDKFIEVREASGERKRPETGALDGMAEADAESHTEPGEPLFNQNKGNKTMPSGKKSDLDAALSKALGGVVLDRDAVDAAVVAIVKKPYAECDENDVIALQDAIIDLGKAYKKAEKKAKK